MYKYSRVRGRRVAIVAGGSAALLLATSVFFASSASAVDEANRVRGTSCSKAARACVDLTKQKAWLIKDGEITRGPVTIASGGPGKETPVGAFQVSRKDKDHKSNEFKLPNGQPSPMPWSVFFAEGGIAFHQGNPKTRSSGCVRLQPADAEAFFSDLKISDRVEVIQPPKDKEEKNSGKDKSKDKDKDKKDNN